MKFALDDYIEKYVKNAKYTANKKIARHLKEIIPQTTHLHRETFKEIIGELKTKMDSGENFKNAFQRVRKKFILTGDTIKAELPGLFTRVIVNKRLMLARELMCLRLSFQSPKISSIPPDYTDCSSLGFRRAIFCQPFRNSICIISVLVMACSHRAHKNSLVTVSPL